MNNRGIRRDQPGAYGAYLSQPEQEKVAQLMYNRFEYEYGTRPSWVDNKRVRDHQTQKVAEVLDSLALSGYKVVKLKEGEEPWRP